MQAAMMIGGLVMQMIGQGKQSSAMDDAAAQQEAAAEQSRRIGEQNAAAQEAETRESVRRESLAAKEQQSLRKARAAASGGTLGGSTGVYLNEQAGREKGYVDWLKRSGGSQAAIEREKGNYAAMEGQAAAKGTRAQAAGAKWDMLGTGLKGAAGLYGSFMT